METAVRWIGAVSACATERVVAARKTTRTRSRKAYIVPKLMGKLLGIHNGKQFKRLRITEDTVGHKLGGFSPTRNACVRGRLTSGAGL
ncbi:30S ribosomal protein S19 [Candidatus Hodgkinia cicadicola]|nr:30S ribosomal protein S19 [Candidatus Hodgkinia cicadicola]